MIYAKQVWRNHYQFSRYMYKGRWISLWHQLDEIVKLQPRNVLEIGPGPGLFKNIAAAAGIQVETVDLDPELGPDVVASATDLPFRSSSYDSVCAFQMLEHLPYDVSLQAFDEMVRVCRRNIIISLPDAKPVWRYILHIPRISTFDFMIPHPFRKGGQLAPSREHYWEINRNNYPLSRIVRDLSQRIPLISTYRVRENPYHRFLIFGFVTHGQ